MKRTVTISLKEYEKITNELDRFKRDSFHMVQVGRLDQYFIYFENTPKALEHITEKYYNLQVSEKVLNEQVKELSDMNLELCEKIKNYDFLPWYKKIFTFNINI